MNELSSGSLSSSWVLGRNEPMRENRHLWGDIPGELGCKEKSGEGGSWSLAIAGLGSGQGMGHEGPHTYCLSHWSRDGNHPNGATSRQVMICPRGLTPATFLSSHISHECWGPPIFEKQGTQEVSVTISCSQFLSTSSISWIPFPTVNSVKTVSAIKLWQCGGWKAFLMHCFSCPDFSARPEVS